MTLRAGVGSASGTDPYIVASEAAQVATASLKHPTAAFVFSAIAYQPDRVIEGVRSVVGEGCRIVGGTTAGEIAGEPLQRPAVVVAAIEGDKLCVGVGASSAVGSNAYAAGEEAAHMLMDDLGEPPALTVVFPDVLAGSGSQIVQGMQAVLGEDHPLVGGAPGDDYRFEKTYQFADDAVLSGAVVALGLTGSFSYGVGVKHGWTPISRPHLVTKAKGSVLYEIDGKPALSLYEEYFGRERAAELTGNLLAKIAVIYPLGFEDARSGAWVIRDPLRVEGEGALVCAGDIPEGATVHLMIGSPEEAVEKAREAGQRARGALNGAVPRIALIFNCIARKKVLAEEGKKEIAAIQAGLGGGVPLAGFYTYGEQAPLNGGKTQAVGVCQSQFLNETVVVLALA